MCFSQDRGYANDLAKVASRRPVSPSPHAFVAFVDDGGGDGCFKSMMKRSSIEEPIEGKLAIDRFL